MFSKTELEYLKAPEKFEAVYSRVLRHRINAKSAKLRKALFLLQGAGINGLSVTENCNSVTENCNGYQSLNQVYLSKISAENGIRTHADREVHGLSRPAR
jgi:hypothetical protein